MKVRISAAAAKFNIHPAHLLQHVVELDRSLCFEDVWPEIEQDIIKTISVSKGYRNNESIIGDSDPGSTSKTNEYNLSDSATKILIKLLRQKKWGDVAVTSEALKKMTHLSSNDLRNAIIELGKKGLLDHDGTGRGTISLASAKHNVIESIAEQLGTDDLALQRH